MLHNADELISEFNTSRERLAMSRVAIHHDCVHGPHKPPALLNGHGAVYVFSLTEEYGSTCPAGAHRVLKVGKVGPNSGPRFQYQHYSVGSAMSTLAGAIVRTPILWAYLGAKDHSESSVRNWLLRNTDRDHFFISGDDIEAITQLERYLKGRLGPAFEGGATAS